jgi:tagaturonate reductase
MKQLNVENYNKTKRKIRIMQFGEGNFLRAFVEWIIAKNNAAGSMDAGVVVVQPMPFGRIKELAQADGLYTLCLEGIDGGKVVESREIIDVLDDFINPYEEYDKFLQYAKSADLEVVVSNTTEAGIALDASDTDWTVCPKSFPGKLLALLKARYDYFKGDPNRGLAIVPCELIDNNGSELRCVMNELAVIANLDAAFINWLNTACHFTDTLVDRIVPGYPRDTAAKIEEETGYLDSNIVKAEVFHLWVLRSDEFIEEKFPVNKAGLNVLYVPDITPYKQRKVKILNGTHTAIVPVAYLAGCDTVGESMADKDVRKFAEGLINDEIKPTIKLPKDEVDAFANSVIERFENPFIRHELMSIALNSTTKFKTRLLPSYNGYVEKYGDLPRHILFAFAALCVFYKGKRGEEDIKLQDNPEYLEFWQQLWQNKDYRVIAETVLARTDIWEQDLSNACDIVAGYIADIDTLGAREALQKFLA